ncbi:MAG: hypothetical protein NVSMB56_01560 [Pyrinomonadaceae bacterium]
MLIGAGRSGQTLIDLLRDDMKIEIVGVTDKNSRAAGLTRAKKLGLPVSTRYKDFLNDKVDLTLT